MTGCITPGGEDLPCAAALSRTPAGGARGGGLHDGCCRDPLGRAREAVRMG